MITEVLARSLTPKELADRLRDHEDPAVRILVEKSIAQYDELCGAREKIQEMRDWLENQPDLDA